MNKTCFFWVLFLVASFYPVDTRAQISAESTYIDGEPIRVGRQPVAPTKIKFYIELSLPYYSEPISPPYEDGCPRDEVSYNGTCHKLLTRGPCGEYEFIIVDRSTNEPTCRERLCAPDRIFVPNSYGNCDTTSGTSTYSYGTSTARNVDKCKQCHDPKDPYICPCGRQLFMNMYGEPICQCPRGTYEGGLEPTDVCEPLLGETPSCPEGYVFGLESLSKHPVCLPDPCGGENLDKGIYEFPYAPVNYDKCFQIGTGNGANGVCQADSYITLALDTFRGSCSTLEKAGYEIFDLTTYTKFRDLYGPPIERGCTSTIPFPFAQTQERVKRDPIIHHQINFHERKRRQNENPGIVFASQLVKCRKGDGWKCCPMVLQSEATRNTPNPTEAMCSNKTCLD
ncbi:uncharacterized protein [Palaemon carinicauda]|uniref:uncharacterized protein isoform X2 n=1 Tax=Palaemon carinicauda TaxID=392227 RepID=UPI0035B6924D